MFGSGPVMMAHIPGPKDLRGFPAARQVKPKTPIRGGGGLRRRWKDPDGTIYEWDSQHGHVEVYDARGNHRGGYDAGSGAKISEADPARHVEP
jgi:hypothetical protein